MRDTAKLRALAAWYREYADRAGNPSIWEARLRMAEDLEQEANRLDRIRPTAVVSACETKRRTTRLRADRP